MERQPREIEQHLHVGADVVDNARGIAGRATGLFNLHPERRVHGLCTSQAAHSRQDAGGYRRGLVHRGPEDPSRLPPRMSEEIPTKNCKKKPTPITKKRAPASRAAEGARGRAAGPP